MPYSQPSRGDVHVNRPLTNISIAFMQSMANFISARVFPNIGVEKKSDVYFVRMTVASSTAMQWKSGDLALPSAGGGYKINTDDYAARVYAYPS